MATFNGTKLGVYISTNDGTSYQLVAASTECSMSITAEVIDISTKDSAAWRQLLPGMRSASLSVSGLIDYTSTDATKKYLPDLFDLMDNRQLVKLRFSNEVVADKRYNCDGYITSLEQSAGTEDTATYSATFEITGAITEQTIPTPP